MENDILSNVLIVWISVGMVFILAEAATGAFYSLALGIAALLVAAYVAVTGEAVFTLSQGAVFAVAGTLFSIFFPRLFSQSVPDKAQWMANYVGKTFPLKVVSGDYKIEIDGVDYLVSLDPSVIPASGGFVRLDSVTDGVFHVSPV